MQSFFQRRMQTHTRYKNTITDWLDIASKVTVMVYFQHISLVALEETKFIPVLIAMPSLLFIASTLGDLPEICVGLMINIKALVPHVCAYFGLACPKSPVFWFHYQTIWGVINIIIIFIAMYMYCVVIVLKLEKRTEEITTL